MTDRSLPMGGDATDDLPRTLRREREARDREAREREMRAAGASFGPPDAGYSHPSAPSPVVYPDEAPAATVKRFDVPFLHLVVFFLKAAVAAVPGLIVLILLMIGATHVAKFAYPGLQGFKLTFLVSDAAEPQARAPASPVSPPAKK